MTLLWIHIPSLNFVFHADFQNSLFAKDIFLIILSIFGNVTLPFEYH